MPGAVRLISLAALLLTAAAGNVAVRSGPVVEWVLLLVVAVVGAVVAGAPAHLWPLPAIWLVATLLVTTTGVPVDGVTLAVSLVAGGVALVAAIAVDVQPTLRRRRRGVRP
ncbi:hypothetical protein SAMN02800687_0183 [Curtobacterium sp. UNCCL20]|nr:hypothetical protein SAMN02800687_0183 [Curtobacterium sp. UNCCL20]